MLSPIKHTVTHSDLDVLQSKVTLRDRLDLDIRVYVKDPTQYLTCHTLIYDLYLSSHTHVCMVDRVGYVYVNLSLPDARMFLTCLYMHYLGWIDDGGVSSHRLKHPTSTRELDHLARVYRLDWLGLLLRSDHDDGDFLSFSPHALYLTDNRLIYTHNHHLTITATPSHTKSFTSSLCGQTWYVVCAAANRSSPLKIWSKGVNDAKWKKLTEAAQNAPKDDNLRPYYDLALTENTHLYVLQDGRRLTCYDTQKDRWTDVALPSIHPPNTAYKMTRTNSGSALRLTLATSADDVFYVPIDGGCLKPGKMVNLDPKTVCDNAQAMEVIRVALRGPKRILINVPLKDDK
ncbi:protein ORF101 [Lake sturgeon herpesvirus]|nr:protein ORF101 [Lake sturgeon herpesvirus]